MIRDAISRRSFKLEFGNYGQLYFNIALLPLFLMAYFTEISEQHIIVVLRFVSTVFAIGTITITFFLARHYFGRLAGWLSAFLLSIVPWKFLQLSIVSHPDILQLFFLVLGMYFCCRLVEENNRNWIIWASISAGLAFACKYSGIFLLPIIWMILAAHILRSDSSQIKINTVQLATVFRYVAASVGIICVIAGIIITPEFVGRYFAADGRIDDVLQIRFLHSVRITTIFIGCSVLIVVILKRIWQAIARIPKLADCLSKITLSVATFCVVFLVTSPFSFYKLTFLKGIYFEARHTAFGHWFKANGSALLWFHVLLSPQLLDTLILILASISLILTIYKASRKGWRNLTLNPVFTMWAWVIFYLSILILRVNILWPHYLLPVIPCLIILSTQPISQVINYFTNKLSRRMVAVLVVSILVIIGGVELPKSLTRLYKYRQSMISREKTSVSVKAGKWIAKHYPPSTRILYDYYSYIPPSFVDAYDTWGGTIEVLEDLKPNIVIINKSISNRFSDIHQAKRYAGGEEEFMEKHEYYKAMREERAGYTLIRDFGDIRMYVRAPT